MFTNCHETQAREALDALGLLESFDGVFGAGGMGETCCKPEPAAFEKLFAHFSIENPRACVFFEDSLKNLRTAKTSFGMRTVLVASPTLDEELADAAASNADVDDADPGACGAGGGANSTTRAVAAALACVDCVVRDDGALSLESVRASVARDAALRDLLTRPHA